MTGLREIVLDTETTGLDPEEGHRIVEIGCVELVNHVPTGRTWHQYVNPGIPMPREAEAVHGIGDADLADKPRFEEVADGFVSFIGDATLVIHNAAFDVKFLNAELGRVRLAPLAMTRVVDTLAMARSRFPGAQASLDALCRRFGVDTSRRVKHGALLDSEILAEVYLELIGGRQGALVLGAASASGRDEEAARSGTDRPARPRPGPRPVRITEAERAAHAAFIATLEGGGRWEDGHGAA